MRPVQTCGVGCLAHDLDSDHRVAVVVQDLHPLEPPVLPPAAPPAPDRDGSVLRPGDDDLLVGRQRSHCFAVEVQAVKP